MDDWDTVTKIGKNVNRGGGGPRQSVVKGRSALNAAQRSGQIIATEKKYATGNASSKAGPDGQFLTKVDRADDVVKTSTIAPEVVDALRKARNDYVMPSGAKMRQDDLAMKCNLSKSEIADWEAGKGLPTPQQLAKLENVLNVKLRGKDVGQPKFKNKK